MVNSNSQQNPSIIGTINVNASSSNSKEGWIFPIKERFKLTKEFLEKYKDIRPNWGPLGEITYMRTYSRKIEKENRMEKWWETCKRVVEGEYTIQLNHIKNLHMSWNSWAAQKSAQTSFDKMFNFKWLPAGRGIYSMGTDVVYERGSMNLFNCSAITSKYIEERFSDPFVFMMSASLSGVGVGFDTEGKNKVKIVEPKYKEEKHIVGDSKEGWCEILKIVLESYVGKEKMPTEIDYSQIRPAGSPIKTSGGTAPGPDCLIKCINNIKAHLDKKIGNVLTSGDIVDLMNYIGVCVVSGGKRRTAQIAFGDYEDKEYIELKNPKKFQEELYSHRWCSNNSIFAKKGMEYDSVVDQIKNNGEPGVIFLDHLKHYGRMKDGYGDHDIDVDMTNPCFHGDNLLQKKTDSGRILCDINNIQIGDFIWSTEGWTKIINKISRGIKPVFEYSTNPRSFILLTDNHNIISNGIKIEIGKSDSIDMFDVMGDNEKSDNKIINKKITEIKPIGEHEVFDITVDNSSHTLWCNGYNVANCGEIGLSGGNGSGGELCNICDIYPSLHDTYEEFESTLKYCYLFCKTVALVPTDNVYTNNIIMKNRRIGISMSGITDAIQKHGATKFFEWCDKGYAYIKSIDLKYSSWLCVPKSIKLTAIKPAGSTSLLPGVSAGIHASHAEYYIRRIRFEDSSPILKLLIDAGYNVEKDVYADNTYVVEFPVKTENFLKGKKDMTIWEQLELGAKMQYYYVDNSVSQTVTFKKEEINDLKMALELYQDRLKTVSFLPLLEEDSGYKQIPYETITKNKYEEMIKDLKPIDFSMLTSTHDDDEEEKYCQGDKCQLPIKTK